MSALHTAISHYRDEMIPMLLRAGADVNVPLQQNRAPVS